MNEKVKDNTCLQPLIIVPSMLGLKAQLSLHRTSTVL